MTQQQNVLQSGQPSLASHCSNQCGGIFKCRAQLGFLLRRTENPRLPQCVFNILKEFKLEETLQKTLVWAEAQRYAFRMSVCFETHEHEDKVWNLCGPVPKKERDLIHSQYNNLKCKTTVFGTTDDFHIIRMQKNWVWNSSPVAQGLHSNYAWDL